MGKKPSINQPHSELGTYHRGFAIVFHRSGPLLSENACNRGGSAQAVFQVCRVLLQKAGLAASSMRNTELHLQGEWQNASKREQEERGEAFPNGEPTPPLPQPFWEQLGSGERVKTQERGAHPTAMSNSGNWDIGRRAGCRGTADTEAAGVPPPEEQKISPKKNPWSKTLVRPAKSWKEHFSTGIPR